MTHRDRTLHLIQRVLLVTGIGLLLVSAVSVVHRAVLSRAALRTFDRGIEASLNEQTPAPAVIEAKDQKIDFTLWSKKRIDAFCDSLLVNVDLPVGVVRIEKLNLRVPVFPGTDELVLNRGLGWIPGTARPGQMGNVGVAGHRDGFFRGLKDIAPGDIIELTTGRSIATYSVDQIEIVTPDDVRVLAPRTVPSLTLVTCYPFYFIGKAPKRFVVHAALKQQVSVNNKRDGGSASARTRL